MHTTLGERIGLARRRAGLSQEELAERIGLGDRTTISKWEKKNGPVPDSRFLLQLPDVLSCSADWLYFGKDPSGATPPREALEALQKWMDGFRGGSTGTGGGGGGA